MAAQTISNALAIGGKTASSINLAPNPTDINTGGITVLLNLITTKPVTGTLVANPEPSLYGAAFTMTAMLTSSAGIAPSGQVAFYLDGNFVGNGTLVPAQGSTITSAASFTIPLYNNVSGRRSPDECGVQDGRREYGDHTHRRRWHAPDPGQLLLTARSSCASGLLLRVLRLRAYLVRNLRTVLR